MSKSQVHRSVHSLPAVEFEKERARRLTSYSGLVLIAALFRRLRLVGRLRRCFRKWEGSWAYGPVKLFMLLVIMIIIGFRRLRDLDYFACDPLVLRTLGLDRSPDVSTLSRFLKDVQASDVGEVRKMVRDLVCERMAAEKLPRVTLDFDGSVLSTRRHAQGTAVGFNKKRKGCRSYYPLFCMVSQLGMFLDMHHRPGNVHDSNGAFEFMSACIDRVRESLPRAKLEARTDSAFFNEDILEQFDGEGVEYSMSLPFESYPQLKKLIEARERWWKIDETWSAFEIVFKPAKWEKPRRVILFRKSSKEAIKGPLQLDLYVPRTSKFEYKAVVTSKNTSRASVLAFHNGRGLCESTLGEGKDCAVLETIPTRRLAGNQLYTCASMLAHNIGRELQLETSDKRKRRATPKRNTVVAFHTLGTIRRRYIQRAGRLTRPQGRLTLTVSADRKARREFEQQLARLAP